MFFQLNYHQDLMPRIPRNVPDNSTEHSYSKTMSSFLLQKLEWFYGLPCLSVSWFYAHYLLKWKIILFYCVRQLFHFIKQFMQKIIVTKFTFHLLVFCLTLSILARFYCTTVAEIKKNKLSGRLDFWRCKITWKNNN